MPTGTPINPKYFTNLTSTVNSATSCAELTVVSVQAVNTLQALLDSINAQALVLADFALLLPLPTDPSSIVTWLPKLSKVLIQPNVDAMASIALQITQVTAAIATLKVAINAKAATFGGSCHPI